MKWINFLLLLSLNLACKNLWSNKEAPRVEKKAGDVLATGTWSGKIDQTESNWRIKTQP